MKNSVVNAEEILRFINGEMQNTHREGTMNCAKKRVSAYVWQDSKKEGYFHNWI